MSQLLVNEGTTTAPAQQNGDLNDFTKVVTVSFIELFLMDEMKKEGTIGTRSPGAPRSDTKPLVRESEEEIVHITQNQVALEVKECALFGAAYTYMRSLNSNKILTDCGDGDLCCLSDKEPQNNL